MIKHGIAPFLECSGRGDKRFSALYARLRVDLFRRSIEEIYQSRKVFANGETNLSWRAAKGRLPENISEVRLIYSQLWDYYIKVENPELLIILKQASGLSDIFGQVGHACQATELWRIRNENE